MFNHDNLKKIKEITKEFFKKTTFEVEIEFLPPKDSTLSINLKADEPQILIGEGGQTLAEIQHLLKVILRKKIASEENFYIDLDINDYKKKKNSYLKELAQSAADEVALTKKEKTLPPMPSYERRIIHLELAGRSDISTESIGQEPERRIEIKPSP
jgi:spoIIIJ-associated protein